MHPKTVRSRPNGSIWILALVAMLLCSPLAGAGEELDLVPRRPARASDYPAPAADQPAERIVIKFHEGTGLRLRTGGLAVEKRSERQLLRAEIIGLDSRQISHDAAEVWRRALEAPAGAGLRRLFQQDEEALDARKLAAEQHSGRELADLNLYYVIELPDATSHGHVADLLAALNAMPSVEVAYVPGIAGNAGFFEQRGTAGPTPDFRALQGYRNPAPEGIDADYAWTITGGRGDDIKIMDVETRLGDPHFPILHEDLPPISPFESVPTSGNPDRDYCEEQHARAVLGELVGVEDNDLGIAGLVPNATAGFESFLGPDYPGGSDISAALMNAADDLQAGDVLLIELELTGPNPGSCTTCSVGNCRLVAVEYEIANFDAISMITAEGKIVVEPAGNGRHSLDDPVYNSIFDRSVRDSGAIFVAASDPGQGPGVAACFTNFGSRIDAHSWGYDVVTTGYGDLFGCVDDPPDCSIPAENCAGGLSATRRYTATFAGTSSASPIVAGAAVSVLGAAQANLGQTLTPEVVRDLLTATGTPPVAGTEIGPQPDLRAALDQLLSPNAPPEPEPDYLATAKDTALLFGSGQLLANDSDPDGDPIFWCGPDAIAPQTPNGMVDFVIANPPEFTYRYTPDSMFVGRDTFSYCLEDDQSAQSSGPVTMTVFEPIFTDDFESADLSAWAAQTTTGSGAISASDKAAIVGGYGMRVDVASSGDRAYVVDSTPDREPVYRADFLLQVTEIEMNEGSFHTIFTARDDVAAQTVIAIRMRRSGGEFQVAAITSRDDGSWAWTSWATVGKQARIAVEWRPNSFVGGELRFIVDGSLAGSLVGLDNDQLRIDQALFGAVFGIDPGTEGSLFFDQYQSGRF